MLGDMLRPNRLFLPTVFVTLTMTLPTANAFAFSFPQTAAPSHEKKPTEPERRKKRRERLVQLLEETLTVAQSLSHAENRAHIQTTGAKLLWEVDPNRAKEMTTAVAASLTDLMAHASDAANDAPDQNDESQNLRDRASQMYVSLLQQTGVANPEFALELFQTARPALNGEDNPQNAAALSQLEYQLESAAARENPQKLYEAAKRMLEKNEYANSVNLFYSVGRDPKLASQLAGDIVTRLQNAPSAQKDPNALAAAFSMAGALQSQTQVDESVQRKLFTFIANSLVETVNSQNELTAVLQQNTFAAYQTYPYLDRISRYAPKQAATLKSLFARELQAIAKSERKSQEYQKLFADGSMEALLKAADSSSPSEARQFIGAAAAKALENGDAEGAKRLIAERISDARIRAQMLQDIDRQRYYAASSEGKYEEAEKLLDQFGSREEKIALFNTRAEAAREKDQARARNLLERALTLATPGGGRAADISQMRGVFGVAQAYAPLDVERAIEILAPNMEHLNELIEAAATLTGFSSAYGGTRLKNGEMDISGYSHSPVAEFTTLAVEGTAAVAQTDLERALTLPAKFHRPEIRAEICIRLLEHLAAELSDEKAEIAPRPPDAQKRPETP
jgi:hypothetical protein